MIKCLTGEVIEALSLVSNSKIYDYHWIIIDLGLIQL